jgi:hypothetical protein
MIEIRDVAPGLWVWRTEHSHWRAGLDWGPIVGATCVESGGETIIIDPILPSGDPSALWARLDARPPTVAIVLKPDHVRDIDAFVERYHPRAFGPELYWRYDIPKTELAPIYWGSELPGGLRAIYDGRGRNETPVWIPDHRTLVFADALTERDGQLRVWFTPWHEERALPALRKLLELPFERVIVSHGEPVHTRADFASALELPTWK